MTTDEEYKRLFAKNLIELKDPFKAAIATFPGDNKASLRASFEWPNDPLVLDIVKESSKPPDLDSLPSKVDLAQSIWDRMNRAIEDVDFMKLAKLYGDVRGFIDKPAQTALNVNNVTNKVMVVVDKGSDEDWEKKLLESQGRLIESSKN